MAHWTYETNERMSRTALCQGDVLKRTQALLAVISRVHPHFADSKYRAFMVLTQSCDLVQREGICKAPYITVAVVRPVEDALDRELRMLCASRPEAALCQGSYVSDRIREGLGRITGSLLNNNIDDYFFLRTDTEFNISGDWCAFLRVTIPLKVEHYSTLLEAKTAELDPVFQAKLGWLIGSVFGRVGTPDWESDEARHKSHKSLVREFLEKYQWISRDQLKKVRVQLGKAGLQETKENVVTLLEDPATRSLSLADLIQRAIDGSWPAEVEERSRNKFTAAFGNQPEYREAMNRFQSEPG